MRFPLPFALALIAPLSAPGAAVADISTVRGYVQEEIHGRAGPGVPGVLVSNGREVARTDADGRYTLPIADGQTLFVIKPARYAVVKDASGTVRHWRHHFPNGSPMLKYRGIARTATDTDGWNFVLTPHRKSADALEVLVFGDPQPKTMTDVGYYERDIVAPLIGRHGATLGLSLGDIVDDDLTLYPAMHRVTAKLGVPWLHLAGNHDLDFDARRDEDSLLSFRNVHGPDTFAWEEPQASFVLLDDVIYQPDRSPAYIGGLRDDQFAFLEAYLPTVPREHLLVLAAHVPFFDTAPERDRETFRSVDRERLFALLEDFPHVLLLSAHTHQQRHYLHGPADGWAGATPLHEYNVGAACGAFWSGVKDAAGIPDATMSDGTPNGYATLTVKGDGVYTLRYRVARAPVDDPALTDDMALHAPRALRRGAYPAFGVYANVFMGREDTVVEYRIDDGSWQPMRRVERADPRLQAENAADDLAAKLRGYDRSPEAVPSTHLWRGVLPTDLALGEHRVEVRAFDLWRGEQRAWTRYRLDRAEE